MEATVPISRIIHHRAGRIPCKSPPAVRCSGTRTIVGNSRLICGNGNSIPEELNAVKEKEQVNYKDYSITFDLAPYMAAVFVF